MPEEHGHDQLVGHALQLLQVYTSGEDCGDFLARMPVYQSSGVAQLDSLAESYQAQGTILSHSGA